MSSFEERLNDLRVPFGSRGDHSYCAGFAEAHSQASEIVGKADELIERLLDTLCNRHADDYVDEIREEYGL